jgi:hypothetical protein
VEETLRRAILALGDLRATRRLRSVADDRVLEAIRALWEAAKAQRAA